MCDGESSSEQPPTKKLKPLNKKVNFRACLPEIYRQNGRHKLVPYVAARLKNKKLISKYLKLCSEKYPLPEEHLHLKRVKAEDKSRSGYGELQFRVRFRFCSGSEPLPPN